MDYTKMKVDELRGLARSRAIAGAWKMKKQELIDELELTTMKSAQASNKQRYIDSLEIGQLIAFTIPSTEKVMSGQVKGINSDGVVTENLAGIRFIVKRKQILWVKTGARWPKAIFESLRSGKVVPHA